MFIVNLYHLKTDTDEKPRCYVLISKAYPNIRFCITLWYGNIKENVIEGSQLFSQKVNVLKLKEVRDPWQIGGANEIDSGLKMLELAFGKDKVDNLIKSITYRKEVSNRRVINLNSIQVAKKLFYEEENLKELNQNFSKLRESDSICYECVNLVSVNSNFPLLEEERDSFKRCLKLRSFKGNLDSLKRMRGTFDLCKNLEVFDSKLPNLAFGYCSFRGCEKLKSFTENVQERCLVFSQAYELD